MKRRDLMRFQFEHAPLEFAHTRVATMSAQLKAGRDCTYPAEKLARCAGQGSCGCAKWHRARRFVSAGARLRFHWPRGGSEYRVDFHDGLFEPLTRRTDLMERLNNTAGALGRASVHAGEGRIPCRRRLGKAVIEGSGCAGDGTSIRTT